MNESAFNHEKISEIDEVKTVSPLNYNRIQVTIEGWKVKPELLNKINAHCSEMLHICEIISGNDEITVEFEF